jgi:glutathione-specific gamma-glutamylcyclotransferase
MPDPAFAHHPELATLIHDPEQSAMRRFDPFAFAALRPELGIEAWLTPPARRTALRRETLAGVTGDVWIFAYGSLMWDPGFRFAEVRRAHVATHARRFILKDTFGGRGTAEQPGVQAALDAGAGCNGLVFRIAAADVEDETEILWRRELAGPAYKAVLVEADTAQGAVQAVAFVADHGSVSIVADLPHADQVRYLATGVGTFGSSFDYLSNIATHFAAMGIRDAEADALLKDVTAFRAGRPERPDGVPG